MTTKSRCWPSCCRCRVPPPTSTSARSANARRLFEALLSQLEAVARQPAGVDGVRGRALDRPDLARVAGSDRRPGAAAAGAAGRHLSPRISAALGRPRRTSTSLALNRLGERDGEALVQTSGRQCRARPRDRRRDRRAHRRGAAVCRGADQGGAGKRRAGRPGGRGAGDGIACRAVGAGDLACLADGAARPARAGGQGDRADRRGARPRVCL